MTLQRTILGLSFWMIFSLLGVMTTTWAGDAMEYRFDSQLPPSDQSWSLNAPCDTGLATDGSLWVGDTLPGKNSLRIRHFDTKGLVIGQLEYITGSATDDLVFFQECNSDFINNTFALAADNSIWLKYTKSLKHFSSTGRLLHEIVLPDGFSIPRSMTIAADGSVWITAQNAKSALGYVYNGVYHFSTTGQLITAIEEKPNSPIPLPDRWLNGIRLASDDSVWLNFSHGLLKHYQANGVLIEQIDLHAIFGNFEIAADGSFWALVRAGLADFCQIQHFSPEGRLLSQFGSQGNNIGQFSYLSRVIIAADSSLWVTDTGNNRIQKFSPKKLPAYPADYDDKYNLLYLDDVIVEGEHYQAKLQLQKGLYRLTSLWPTLNAYKPPAQFDATTNLLSIPLLRAFGKDYQATFNYLGKFEFDQNREPEHAFQLQAATPK